MISHTIRAIIPVDFTLCANRERVADIAVDQSIRSPSAIRLIAHSQIALACSRPASILAPVHGTVALGTGPSEATGYAGPGRVCRQPQEQQ